MNDKELIVKKIKQWANSKALNDELTFSPNFSLNTMTPGLAFIKGVDEGHIELARELVESFPDFFNE